MCVASSSQGVPDALTTRFSLALPWWMPSPSLFAVFESKGSSLVILAFLSSQLDVVACCRPVPKLHLAGRDPDIYWQVSMLLGASQPPRPVSKTYPRSTPERVTLSLPSHSSGNNCFPGQWAAWSPVFLLSWSLRWIIPPCLCAMACLNIPSMTKPAEADTWKTSPLSFCFSFKVSSPG